MKKYPDWVIEIIKSDYLVTYKILFNLIIEQSGRNYKSSISKSHKEIMLL